MKGPVVEVVGIDEGLVKGEAVFGVVGVAGVAGFGIEADLVARGVVGVELLEKALVRPEFPVGVVVGDEAKRCLSVVMRKCGDEGEDVIAKVAGEGSLVLGVGNFGFKGGDRGCWIGRRRGTCRRDAHTP